MAKINAPYNLEITEGFAACRNHGFFQGLSNNLLKKMEEVSFSTSYPDGALLFVEGENPRGVYVLTQGRVKLTVDSAEGKTLILKVAQPGELLGLSACMLNQSHQITVETLTPCQVSLIRRPDFMRLMADGEMCLKVAEHLSTEYHEACRELTLVGLSRSADLKLASLLLQMTSSGPGANRNACKLTFTHEEISQIIGTSRETVTRVLARLRRSHIIEIQGARLTVRNHAALSRIARGEEATVPASTAAARPTPFPQPSRSRSELRLAAAAV